MGCLEEWAALAPTPGRRLRARFEPTSLHRDPKPFVASRNVLTSNRWINVRYNPLAYHLRFGAEEAATMLVRCTDRSLWPVRRRSAGGFLVRRPDQLHDRFPAEALPDRGEPASNRPYGVEGQIERTSLRENPVPDARHLVFRAGRPPYRTDAGRLPRLRRRLSAYDRQSGADATRGRDRAEGIVAGTRL